MDLLFGIMTLCTKSLNMAFPVEVVFSFLIQVILGKKKGDSVAERLTAILASDRLGFDSIIPSKTPPPLLEKALAGDLYAGVCYCRR